MKRWLIGVLVLTGVAAHAHEMRHPNHEHLFMLHVGFKNEPAFSGEINGIDLNVSLHDDANDPEHTVPINMRDVSGDGVTLDTAELLYLSQDQADAKVLHRTGLDGATLSQVYGTNSDYVLYFRPSKAGAYGFHLTGKLSHNGVTRNFDETFICGNGSQDRDASAGAIKSKFGCVSDAINFPNGALRDKWSKLAPKP